MLGQSDIAINSLLFWLVAGLAIAALNIITSLRGKTLAFGAVNLTFLLVLLGQEIVYVIAFIATLFVALRLMPSKRVGVLAIATTGAAILTLFVANKLHTYFPAFSPAARLLSLVGYSFIALRCVEVIRAVATLRMPPPRPLELLNYLVPFHMLAAGPIQAYEDYVSAPFIVETITTASVVEGVEEIASGLFNKFVVCYIIKKLFLTDFAATGPYFTIEILIFTYWSYLDFSSYSRIALGIGKLSGVSTPVNFNHPFRSRNVIEFWDRWHISLSHFVKRNVFMPIQITLMRRSAKPHPLLFASFATAVSFVLVGAWHGMTPGWIVWGSLHALGLIGVRLYTFLLQRHLSPVQLAAYRTSVPIRYIAVMVTYIYVAFAFIPVAMLTHVAQ